MRALTLLLVLSACGTIQGAVCPPIPVVKTIMVKPVIQPVVKLDAKVDAKGDVTWPDHYEDNDTHSRLQRIENKTDNLLAHTKDTK